MAAGTDEKKSFAFLGGGYFAKALMNRKIFVALHAQK